MPLWDDWSDAFLLSEGDVVSVPIDTEREVWDRTHVAVLFPQISEILHGDATLFRGKWIDHPIKHVFGWTVSFVSSQSIFLSIRFTFLMIYDSIVSVC